MKLPFNVQNIISSAFLSLCDILGLPTEYAANDKGAPVSAGLYLYLIKAGEFRQTKKMVLLI